MGRGLVGHETDPSGSRWNVKATELFTEGLDLLPVGLAVFDSDDRLVSCNETLGRIYHSLPEAAALAGWSFAEILALIVESHEIAGEEVASDPQAWVAYRLAAHRDPAARPVEEQLADGRWFRIEERSLSDGGVICLWQDVTAIRLLDLRMADAASALVEGLALWDQRDRLVLFNEQFAGFLPAGSTPLRWGESFGEVILRLYESAMAQENPAARTQVEGWRNAHHQLFGRTVIRRGDERWFLIKEQRSRDGGTVTLVSDITELKNRGQIPRLGSGSLERSIGELASVQSKLQQQGGELAAVAEELALARHAVEQADASKTRFLRSISHELRTPLNAIIGFSEVLRDGLLGPLGNPRYEEYANDIHASGSHLLSLVNQLLDLSRIEAGRYELELEPQDIGEVVRNSVRLVSKQIEDAGLYLINDLPDELPSLVADQQAVRQILVNLLSNSVKFTPSDGEIRISAEIEDDWLVVVVSDTGIGIPPDKIPRLMRPFERVDNGLDRSTEGTGLGLAISRSLAEMHGGKLDLESGIGEGTRATLRLPLRGPDEHVHYFSQDEVGAAQA